MKLKKMIIAAGAALLAAGCAKEPPDPMIAADVLAAGNARATFTITTEEPVTITRTMDENAVSDLHLFLFGPGSYHFPGSDFTTDGGTGFTLSAGVAYGDYEV